LFGRLVEKKLAFLSSVQDGDKFYRKQLLEQQNILLFSTKGKLVEC